MLGTTHDIDHLLLIGTAKIHSEPIHIVVYGQCLAALMIFTIYYRLGLPKSTLVPTTSWCRVVPGATHDMVYHLLLIETAKIHTHLTGVLALLMIWTIYN